MNDGLESFLKEVKKYVPAKEATLFAVGGRGYYENPASDLLAFFFKPDEEHRLGDLFLSTYLECMAVHHLQLNTKKDVDVRRNERTVNGNFIDMQIKGLDWCLLIENKIYHGQTNPFEDYETHAKRLREKTIFSILSPDGHSEAEGWSGVSYKTYCQALRERMAVIFFASPFSKWHLFAREFILHMENELYDPPMTPEQVTFVEKHDDQIAEAERLAGQYRLFIRQELKRRLEESVPGNIFDTSEASWPSHWLVFRCKSQQWGESQVVLYKPEGRGQKFTIRAYLANMSELQLSSAKHALKHMTPPEIDTRCLYWDSPTGYDSREEAIAELCKLAQIVNDLLSKRMTK